MSFPSSAFRSVLTVRAQSNSNHNDQSLLDKAKNAVGLGNNNV
jgi:hypothetical protein